MSRRKLFVALNLVLVVGLVSISLPRPAGAQVTATPLQLILNLLSSGEISHSWSSALPAAERFVELAEFNNAAVLDRNTGLVWQKSVTAPPTLTFEQAQYYCLNTAIGGQKGWRIPIVTELTSLVDPANSNPALPTGSPFGTDPSLSNFFWTGSIAQNMNRIAWVVNFGSGVVGGESQLKEYPTRCVRGGTIFQPFIIY
jgi:hypothetical protein